MKNFIKLTLLFAFIFSMQSCSDKKKLIIGTWQVKVAEGMELTGGHINANVIFDEGNKITMTHNGEERTGTWEWSEDGKIITTKIDERESVMRDIQLTSNELIFYTNDKINKLSRTETIKVNKIPETTTVGQFLADYEEVVVKWETKTAESSTALTQTELSLMLSEFAPFERRAKEIDKDRNLVLTMEQIDKINDIGIRVITLTQNTKMEMQ